MSIRRVDGNVSRLGTFDPIVIRFNIPDIPPGESSATFQAVLDGEYQLQLEFDDDNGLRWSKYGATGGLVRIDEPHAPTIASRRSRRIGRWEITLEEHPKG
jgi:hypothetical protein